MTTGKTIKKKKERDDRICSLMNTGLPPSQ